MVIGRFSIVEADAINTQEILRPEIGCRSRNGDFGLENLVQCRPSASVWSNLIYQRLARTGTTEPSCQGYPP